MVINAIYYEGNKVYELIFDYCEKRRTLFKQREAFLCNAHIFRHLFFIRKYFNFLSKFLQNNTFLRKLLNCKIFQFLPQFPINPILIRLNFKQLQYIPFNLHINNTSFLHFQPISITNILKQLQKPLTIFIFIPKQAKILHL